MTTAHALDDALSPELEAIAAAAHDRLQAHAGQDLSAQEAAQRRVAEAASAAIAAGAALSVIADAEHTGRLRARRALSTDVLRHVTHAAEAQARGRQRIRAGHRSRRADRTLTPRDRHRRRGLARNRPRDPRPQQHKPERQRPTNRHGGGRGDGRRRIRSASALRAPARSQPRTVPGGRSRRGRSCDARPRST
jgi:hypothetical protein